jgi:hypothetical protein
MIKEIHYYSGLTIALFVGFHLLNHLLILHSEALHIRFMRAARKVYRLPAVEGVLLTAVLVQVLSGIFLIIQKWPKATGWFDWLQICSGAYLAFFLTNHIRAVIIGRIRLRVDTNLYYGAGVMNMWPQKLFFIPYYALAIVSFCTHVACIHRVKMQEYVSLDVAEKQAAGVIAMGILMMVLIIFRMSRLRMSADSIRKEIRPEV